MKPFILTAETSRRRSPRAVKAQRVGSAFQKAIVWSAGMQRDVVALEELPAFGAKHVGVGRTVFTPICCDFVGALVNISGLFFDGKSTDADALDVKTMLLKREHQLKFLRRMHHAGQAAGYLVECRGRQRYLWLDVGHIVDDGPIRFARDGVLCRQWVDCGAFTGPVDFKKIKERYV